MSNPAGAKLCSSLCRTVSHRCCVKFACPRHPPSGRKAVLGLVSRTCVAIPLVFPRSCWQRGVLRATVLLRSYTGFFGVVQSAETGMPSRAGTQKAQKCTGELNALLSTTSLCVSLSAESCFSRLSSRAIPPDLSGSKSAATLTQGELIGPMYCSACRMSAWDPPEGDPELCRNGLCKSERLHACASMPFYSIPGPLPKLMQSQTSTYILKCS